MLHMPREKNLLQLYPIWIDLGFVASNHAVCRPTLFADSLELNLNTNCRREIMPPVKPLPSKCNTAGADRHTCIRRSSFVASLSAPPQRAAHKGTGVKLWRKERIPTSRSRSVGKIMNPPLKNHWKEKKATRWGKTLKGETKTYNSLSFLWCWFYHDTCFGTTTRKLLKRHPFEEKTALSWSKRSGTILCFWLGKSRKQMRLVVVCCKKSCCMIWTESWYLQRYPCLGSLQFVEASSAESCSYTTSLATQDIFCTEKQCYERRSLILRWW